MDRFLERLAPGDQAPAAGALLVGPDRLAHLAFAMNMTAIADLLECLLPGLGPAGNTAPDIGIDKHIEHWQSRP